MITATTCYVIECDKCSTKVYDGADIDGIPHWPSEAFARKLIVPCPDDCDASEAEFHERGDRLLCSACAHRADCAERGHQWDAWRVGPPGRRYRYCDHCPDSEAETVDGGAS